MTQQIIKNGVTVTFPASYASVEDYHDVLYLNLNKILPLGEKHEVVISYRNKIKLCRKAKISTLVRKGILASLGY